MAQLVVINGIDFTGIIPVPHYKMNRTDVVDTWTDGNKNEHEYIVRQQISGTFTIKPLSIGDFHLFCSTIKANKIASGKNSGAVLASLYVNNEDTVADVYVRMKFEPENILPLLETSSYEGFEVSVTEV